MGRYRSVPEGSNRVKHKMILSLVSSVALAAPGASNYGAAAAVGPAKQIASPSIQCRTEYVTLWDTEYQEKEEQICNTVYEKQCTQRIQRLCQPTTRQECHTEYEQQCNTIYKNSVSRSTGQNTSLTQSLNAQLSTSKIANLNGGVMATTRCGPPSREPARTFPTTSARMCRRPTPSKLRIRSATTSQSRSVCPFPSRSASPFPTRCAPANPSPNAKTFLAKPATPSTRGSQSE